MHRTAKVDYRWHDLRRTFVTRLAENPSASEETVRKPVGHVSRWMPERCSDISTRAKENAIRALERSGFEGEGAQNWARSAIVEKPALTTS